jgi:TonB family protein
VKRGLKGKGVVLVTIDKDTGQVTGAQMLQSTGSKELDGSALEAYSRWRFAPGTVSQVKIPVEFTNPTAPSVQATATNSLSFTHFPRCWCASYGDFEEKETR